MILSKLEVIGFRNLSGTLNFGSNLNVFYGENAQGKTNWLEAVYVLGNTKSFRTSHLDEAIEFSSQQAIIRGCVLREGLEKDLQICLTKSSKLFFVNGKRESVSHYIGNLDVFVFSNEELGIVRGEPSERRRFLDRGIVSLNPAYLKLISDYNHVIKQKNNLLKQAQEATERERYKFIDLIQVWNEQLADLGAKIHTTRTQYVERLERVASKRLFGKEEISIRYRSSLEGRGDLSNYRSLLAERLELRLPNEISAGYSLVGPHRDDLDIYYDGREVSRFGSSGQQRSALLILDLAQISLYNQVLEETPVFIIDDIDAELDRNRIDTLLDFLDGKAQTFISTSKSTVAESLFQRAYCHLVEAGRAARISQSVEGVRSSSADRTGGIDSLDIDGADKHRAPF